MQPILIKNRKFLGQPAGIEIQISHTREIHVGDMIWIDFPFGSRGWIKYGGTETFTVVDMDPATGEIHSKDESGGDLLIQWGTKEEMLSRLSNLTSYTDVKVIRPDKRAQSVIRRQKALDFGMPDSYQEISPTSFSELQEKDILLDGLFYGVPRLFAILGPDPETGTTPMVLIASDSPEDKQGDIWPSRRTGSLFESKEEQAYREPQEGIPTLAYAGAAAVGLIILIAAVS